MPFVIDTTSGAAQMGESAGAFAGAFAGAVQKRALVEAEVAKANAWVAAQKANEETRKAQEARAAMADRAAQDLARYSATWLGPDRNFVGADKDGNFSDVDAVRRHKMQALDQIARNLPAEMLPEFKAAKALEMEEEIVQAQRETIQNKLADLQSRLALDQNGQGDLYKGEIEEAIKALDNPNSDPRQAEEVYNRIGQIVTTETVKQQERLGVYNLLGSFMQEAIENGQDNSRMADIYGRFLGGQLEPAEARAAAIREKFNLGPRKWKIPGTNEEYEIHSNLMMGNQRHIDKMDDASAAEAWLLGVGMARKEPGFENLLPEEQEALAKRFAMAITKAGGWFVPPGWLPVNERPPPPPTPGSPEARAWLDQAAASGAFKSEEELRAAIQAAGFDPDMPLGSSAGPAQESGFQMLNRLSGGQAGKGQKRQSAPTPPPSAPGTQPPLTSPSAPGLNPYSGLGDPFATMKKKKGG